jgi:S-adenosylmethionine decarboxylase
MNALARLGMVSETPSENQTTTAVSVELATARNADLDAACNAEFEASAHAELAKDYFVERDGQKFAGMHLLIDIWGATKLDDPELIDKTLCDGAIAAGATILHSHFHHFTPNGGVSGVVVLAESHISIHTWPERNFAALDVFMCGECDPYKVIPFLQAAFGPTTVEVDEQRRGIVT